jgi:hypothetical protein
VCAELLRRSLVAVSSRLRIQPDIERGSSPAYHRDRLGASEPDLAPGTEVSALLTRQPD